MTNGDPLPEVRWRRRRSGRGIRATVVILSGTIAVLAAALWAVAWVPVQRSRRSFAEGRIAEAIANSERWLGFQLWAAQHHQILAAGYLAGGKQKEAGKHLAALPAERLWFSALPKDLVAQRLFSRDRYGEFLKYDRAVRELREPADVMVHRAAAQIATGQYSAAETTLGSVDRAKAGAQRRAAVEAALAVRRGGTVPLVLDRRGGVIASYHVRNRDLVAVDGQFAPLVEAAAGPMTIESRLTRLGTNQTTITTLDPEVQRAALAALSGFRGSLVAIDPKNGEVLALASSAGDGAIQDLAIGRQFEPGSIVKVLTGLAAAAGGLDSSRLFPYICTGELLIDGRHFGDWLATGHGELPTFDDAMAESCNVVFADIGLRLGVERLKRFLAASGFDDQVDLGFGPVPLGRIIPPIYNRFETAFLAIGLEHESVNALHVATIASMMANRGKLVMPRMVSERRTITGEPAGGVPRRSERAVVTPEVAERVVTAMRAVVTREKGTGRRAAIDTVPIAMKTGTAGSREGGLEAVIMGFAPADDPQIAFGIIAEDAGPAEYAGAKIARDFVMAVVKRK